MKDSQTGCGTPRQLKPEVGARSAAHLRPAGTRKGACLVESFGTSVASSRIHRWLFWPIAGGVLGLHGALPPPDRIESFRNL